MSDANAMERLKESLAAQDWAQSAALCQQEIAKGTELGTDDWYSVRAMLASVVLKLPKKMRDSVISMAIDGLEEIVASARLASSDPRVAKSYRSLGYLYSIATVGGADENRRKTIESYSRALGGYDPDEAPKDWATVKVALGVALMEGTRDLTVEKLQAVEPGDRVEAANLAAAIRHFEDALSVYTEEDWAEKHAETVRLIDSAHKLLDVLGEQSRVIQ